MTVAGVLPPGARTRRRRQWERQARKKTADRRVPPPPFFTATEVTSTDYPFLSEQEAQRLPTPPSHIIIFWAVS